MLEVDLFAIPLGRNTSSTNMASHWNFQNFVCTIDLLHNTRNLTFYSKSFFFKIYSIR